MYNQNLKKYNVAINNLNREISKLKQALFTKTKKCKELEETNIKFANKIAKYEKEIRIFKSKEKEAPAPKETSTKRSYKKKK